MNPKMTKMAMLDMCIDLVNMSQDPNSIGVTLLVGGSFISGDLINKITYYKILGRELESANCVSDTDKANLIGECINISLKERETLNESAQEKQEFERGEIYLKNIKILTGLNFPISFNNGLLALSADAIEGFIWGTPTTDA